MTVEHSALTGASLHEPKGVATAGAQQAYIANGVGSGTWIDNYPKGTPTAAAGAVLRTDGAGGASWLRVQGWAQYEDTNTTVGTPSQTLAAGVAQAFTCDGGTLTLEKNPEDAAVAMWDVATDKHVPIAEFDVYHLRLQFTAENYAGATPYLEIALDIGGAIGEIYWDTIDLRKGGAAQKVSIAFPVFTGATYFANGGTLNITYQGTGNCDIYKNSLLVIRESKAYV